MANFILHYNSDNSEVFSEEVAHSMSNSTIILIVLSDNYLMEEWNNARLRSHVRFLTMNEDTRLYCIQLHDICDEEVEEYFRSKLQVPYLVALENDEFLFWQKLHYHLMLLDRKKEKVMPRYLADRPNDELEFKKYSISRPIVHLDGVRDPFERDLPDVKRPLEKVCNISEMNVCVQSARSCEKLIVEADDDDDDDDCECDEGGHSSPELVRVVKVTRFDPCRDVVVNYSARSVNLFEEQARANLGFH